MKHSRQWLALVVAGLFVSMTGQAAHAEGAATVALKALDPDKDGTLDWNEVKAAAEAKFDRLEKDKDGTLDRKEVRGLHLSAGEFKKGDPDKDGTLDKAEYVAIVQARFNKVDHDADGTLDAKELRTAAGRALLALIK